MILGIIYGPHSQDGRIWAAYLLAATKITDIGGYFGGSLWGRRKLAPNISRGKTLEGAIFGLILSVGTSFIFYLLGKSIGALHFSLGSIEWIYLGVIMGCIGQFGDLSESLLKRDANKKDSNTLPGFGGALDAVDSLLFNAPILYFYLLAFHSGA
jgi:phosphatidate cytidylyltransferase